MSSDRSQSVGRAPLTCGLLACWLSLLVLAACGGGSDEPAPDRQPGAEAGRQQAAATAAESSGDRPEPAAAEPSTDPSPPRLEAAIGTGGRRVSGSYGDLRFAAELSAEGRAQARFERRDAGPLVVDIEGPGRGAVAWADARIDGVGAPTEAEIELLTALEADYPTAELALVALDLACEPEAETIDPAIGAALLMPFQMQLYYRMPAARATASIRELARRSACQHLRRPMDEIDPGRTPSPSVVALTAEQPAPMAYGYFPFEIDGEDP